MPENPWRRTCFWVPVYVGVPEPTAPDAFVRAPAPNPTDVTTWGARIVEGYNEARLRAGKQAIDDRRAPARPGGRAERALGARGPRAAARRGPRRQARRLGLSAARLRRAPGAHRLGLRLRRTCACSSPPRGAACSRPDALRHRHRPHAQRARRPKGEIDYTLIEDEAEPVPRFDLARDRPRVYAALDARCRRPRAAPPTSTTRTWPRRCRVRGRCVPRRQAGRTR